MFNYKNKDTIVSKSNTNKKPNRLKSIIKGALIGGGLYGLSTLGRKKLKLNRRLTKIKNDSLNQKWNKNQINDNIRYEKDLNNLQFKPKRDLIRGALIGGAVGAFYPLVQENQKDYNINNKKYKNRDTKSTNRRITIRNTLIGGAAGALLGHAGGKLLTAGMSRPLSSKVNTGLRKITANSIVLGGMAGYTISPLDKNYDSTPTDLSRAERLLLGNYINRYERGYLRK